MTATHSLSRTSCTMALTALLSLTAFCSAWAANPQAPTFSGETLRGDRLSLSHTDNKPTLLVFWASWCGVCMSEVPALKNAYSERSERLNIIGINLDKTPEKGLRIVQERDLPYPSVKDGNLIIADQYDVHGTPTLYVISPSGELLQQTNRLNKALDYLDTYTM